MSNLQLQLQLQLKLKLLLLVLAVQPLHETERIARNTDPEGAAHGWAAFSDRGRMPSRKILLHVMPRAVDVSGRRFSLVPFLLGSTKRNELGRASGRKRLICASACASGDRSKVKRFHSPCGERVHFFCWPKRNGTKEKGQPRRSSPRCHPFRHFPTRHPWLDRKTAGIHARRPPGVRCAARPIGDQERAGARSISDRGRSKAGTRSRCRVTPTPKTGTPIPSPSAPSHPAHWARASCAGGGCARRPCVPRRRRCRPRHGRAAASGCRRVRDGS